MSQRLKNKDESQRKDSDDRGEDTEKDVETSGCDLGKLEAVKISVRVVFLDEFDNVVTRGSKGDVVGHSSGHSGMQESDQLAFSVENGCARVTFAGEVAALLAIVEDRDLPGILVGLAAGVGLQLREATKGKIRRLPILGDDEGRVVIVVREARISKAGGVDITQQPEKMVVWVIEGSVGDIEVEERDDLVAGKLAS